MRAPHPAVSAQLDELLGWFASGEPLAIDPDWIIRMMAANAASRREVEGFFFLFGEKEPLSYTLRDGVAAIPVRGPIARRSEYRVTYDEIASTVEKAVRDDRVDSILLDVDSPGGIASGMHECATRIRAAAGQKKLVALANDYMTSAAYGISSGASNILATRFATVGSIGTVLTHLDFSKQNEMLGIKPTFIIGGRKKVIGNPDEPLSDEARTEFQSLVNHHYDAFVDLVAEHRGLDRARVAGTEAGTFLPDEARSAGLIDEVATFDECVGALAAERRAKMPEDSKETKDLKDKPQAPVVDLDEAREKARVEGRREAAERARDINRLCALARRPDLAAGFIESEKTTRQVSDELIELRAKEDAKDTISGVHGQVGSATRSLADSMVSYLKARGLNPRAGDLPAAKAVSGEGN